MVRGLRDIGGESVLLAGGGRAILLQLAHPAVGRGVARHSDFHSRPLDRLNSTMTYAYAVVYGTADEVRYVRRLVNRAHGPVRGSADDSGPAYSAFDPELQLWVAATLYDTAVTVYERVLGPIDEASAEQIYQDYAVIGTALQVPEELWPANRAAFSTYWTAMLERLEVTDEAIRVANELLHPVAGPRWLRPVMPLARLTTAGLLPPEVRRAYRFDWGGARERRFTRWMGFTRLVYPKLPTRVRHTLRDRYLATLRERMASDAAIGASRPPQVR
jgi:uncharacterized protein (DUF2236 family)